ncbi:MAG TPA: CpsB/CapC family capsule biosynthesis tyrosine phosphatase [Chitinophagaceae bacterium]
MFGLFSKSKHSSQSGFDYQSLGTDMHSHLLPGIDDGSPSLEVSLELIRGMAALGYKKLITTPHIMWDMYKNTPAIINEKLGELQTAVSQEGLDITIAAAAEYFLDEYVEQLLRNKEPLLTLDGKLVLVEFSLAFPAHGLKDILFEMQMQGYVPVIAHPERYVYLENTKDFYDELKDIGCLFQLNLLSLGNHYGKSVNQLAHYLIKKDYYNFIGTDLHHTRHLTALRQMHMDNALKNLLHSGLIRNAAL